MTRARRAARWVGPIAVLGLLVAGWSSTSAGPGAWEVSTDGTAPVGPPEDVDPILSEEFEDEALDEDVWSTCHWWVPEGDGCTIASNDEQQWYVDEAVSVDDGRLALAASEDPIRADGDTFPYRSGMISSGPRSYEGDTEARFDFTYGYVEARLRFPEGTGLWPSFWLLPSRRESRPEIDIVEVLGDTPDIGRYHYHWVDPEGERRSLGRDVEDDDLADGGWHVYAVDWRPGSITWIVDGAPVWKVVGPSVPSEPMYVVLNLAVGGEWPGPPDDDTEFPAEVEADWIKVWPAP